MEIKKGEMIIWDTHNKLIETSGGVTCSCLQRSLTMVAHMQRTDGYIYQYKCVCGNVIGVQKIRPKVLTFM